jgi:hypothetical protein
MKPSRADVERTIRMLELPWWEAWHVRLYYGWARQPRMLGAVWAVVGIVLFGAAFWFLWAELAAVIG